ncbi:MAG: nitroreductase family protein [Clostridiales bacterium]|jgi:nitroreductase|nr:nitroreductase family protein [Clostridiales bacterium]
MNETLAVINKRYSCRAYTDQTVPDESLRAAAEAGAAAPSANNSQRWSIAVVSDKKLVDELEAEGLRTIAAMPDKTLHERIQSRGVGLFYNAPAIVVVSTDQAGGDGALLDCGIVVENITIAAASLGIASCICGLAGLAFSDDQKAAYFKEKLKFPDGYRFGMAILLGYEKAPGTPHAIDPSKIAYIR